MTAPASHITESHKLTLDALVDLFEVQLAALPVIWRFKDDGEATWQGNTYEHWPCQFTGDERTADAKEARPKLRIVNPEGVFNSFVMGGNVERATVIRRRLLRRHLASNSNIYEQRIWYVSRIPEMISGQAVTLELRNMSEGPRFMIPVRQFIPPEFPFVTV